jgi:hypothetical protein
MREKREKGIVTFPTTTAAMAMEHAAHACGVQGRLIPVPRTIRAGCGMCWAFPLEIRTEVEELVIAKHLMIDGIYDIIL